MSDAQVGLPRAYFTPRPLENLALADELESLDPIIDSKVLNLLPNSDTPQIFAACGRGARSSLRTLRHGLEVEESVSSELPGIPNAVWTTKRTEDGKCCFIDDSFPILTSSIKTPMTPTSSFLLSTALLSSPSAKPLKKFKILVSSLLHLPSQFNRSVLMLCSKSILTASDMFLLIDVSMNGVFHLVKPS